MSFDRLPWRWILGGLCLLLLPLSCLERSTGIARPLDPRFTAGGPEAAGQVVELGPGSGPAEPFVGLDPDDAVMLSGRIEGELAEPVDMDLRTPDPAAEGGQRNLGKVLLAGPGEFALLVPRGLGLLSLQAFQDLGSDGPGAQDPFATLTLLIGDEDQEDLLLTLVVGGVVEATSGSPSSSSAFPDHPGPWTTLLGTVQSSEPGSIAVDFRAPDPSSPTGDRFVSRTRIVEPGPFSIDLPRGFGPIVVQIFQDADEDGPDQRDPFAELDLVIGDEERIAADVVLKPGAFLGAPVRGVGGGGGGGALFDELGEDPVTVSGTLRLVGISAEVVDVDVYAVDPEGHGGRRFLKKLKIAPGPYSFQAPRGAGGLILEALIDAAGDGPSPEDPSGTFPGNPLIIGDEDLSGVDITVPGA